MKTDTHVVIHIEGVKGSGKTTIMQIVARALSRAGLNIVPIDDHRPRPDFITPPETPPADRRFDNRLVHILTRTTSSPVDQVAMDDLDTETRNEVLSLVALAERRLGALRPMAQSAYASELRVAIDDVKTPLSLAHEALVEVGR